MNTISNHIVILTPGFPENEADTSCIPALQIYVKALQEISGYKISVVSVHKPFKNTVYKWHQIPVYALGGSSFIFKFFLWKKAYRTLRQIHQEQAITIVHSFWLGECALLGYWFSKKYHLKYLTTLMGQDVLNGNVYAKILPLQKLHLITLSKYQHDVFYKNYNSKTKIIPWGIYPDNFQFSTEKTLDIIGVGNLVQLKNYEEFITIIHQLNQIKPVKAILIGDGNQRDVLQKKIAQLQLENVIILKGALTYHETLKHISQSKILLHTSHFESFGLVFAEALQCKTMIVSRNIGCAYPSENWAMAQNETAMIQACNMLLLKSFAEEEKNPFTIEKTVLQYIEIYNE